MASSTQSKMKPQMDINSIKDVLLTNLKEDDLFHQFVSQFESKQNDGARVKHVYQYLHHYQLMPKKPYTIKCDYYSNESKNEGNKCFVDKEYMKAVDYYNTAIKYSMSSETKSVAFANRSAALFRLKKYRESLLDIERAIDAGYCERLMPKLMDRKKRCEEAIELNRVAEAAAESEKENIRKQIFQLPEKRMIGVPCASASLEISNSASMGRGVKATEDIQPGQVLVVEDSYVSVLYKGKFDLRCYFCCSRNFAMIACETCTYVMYCNEECRIKSWNHGHKFECRIMPRLVHMNFGPLVLVSMRILLQAKSQHSSWDEMFKTIESVEKETDPKLKGFTLDSDNVLKYDVKNYAPIHMLDTNMEKSDKNSIYVTCLNSAVLLYMLKEYTPFFSDRPKISDGICIMDDEYVWRVGGLLSRHSLSIITNIFIAFGYVKNFQNLNLECHKFAIGIYAFSSLFNHSCVPNSTYIFRGTTITIMAQRFIKKGHQVYISYGPEYHKSDLRSRQFRLEKRYKFKCKCEACIHDWSPRFIFKGANFISEKNKEQFRHILDDNSVRNLLENDKPYDLEFIKQVYKNIMLLEECIPCTELIIYKRFIEIFWRLLGNFENSKYEYNADYVSQFLSILSSDTDSE